MTSIDRHRFPCEALHNERRADPLYVSPTVEGAVSQEATMMMAVEDRPGQGAVRQVLSAWFVLTALAVATLVISIV